MKSEVIHTRIDKKMLKALKRFARKADMKQSEIIRLALENYLAR